MTITMRVSRILAASALAASAGLATGIAAAPAGANPGGGFELSELCSPMPSPPENPGDLAPNPQPEDDGGETNPTGETGGESVDVPIPASANFTG